jgi:hypothetical protein
MEGCSADEVGAEADGRNGAASPGALDGPYVQSPYGAGYSRYGHRALPGGAAENSSAFRRRNGPASIKTLINF